MKEDKLHLNQLKALLKKDISLLFRKKVAIFIFGGPFILMFILIGLPALFTSQGAIVLLVHSEDIGYLEANIGESIAGNISLYFDSDETIEVQITDNLTEVLYTSELGYYIPTNFSEQAFTGIPVTFTIDATLSPYTSSIFSVVQTIASNVMVTYLANRSIPPLQNYELPPESLPEEQLLGPKAAAIAMPLSYMIFLLIAMNSGSYSLIGFAREKRMRTMEILLSYTHNHSYLVISKVITGLVASLGSTLSYVLGILVGTQLSGSNTSGLLEVFGLNLDKLSAGDIIISLIFVVIALLVSTLLTMAIDCNLTREASERVSPLISIGLAMFFYFVVMMNPFATSSALLINPFYWCYRLGLLLIAGVFSMEIFLYFSLISGLVAVLIFFATRGIQKEKSLYLE
ncbi:MAG: ABC transporter permease [Candidatus Heimdallarchaeota archaeon]|nr:ABC transporter permease [Candidatus Heimdallarchaeota archaeon]